ncbi:hypothetical protein HOP54_02495 [Halomonas daqingensis]|uniref:hypothetical protein n=1 Tax=Billgrantia desiderata TaxID=52021 RepID=UPI001F24F239|nr:hypothetical protein [Halomonas desiderata]MCE8027559.1 hypothetical protein [Halomonas desiderata]
MDSRPPPPGGQPDLLVIAEVLEAVSRLAICTGQVLEDTNWPLFSVVAGRLVIHAQCVRMADSCFKGIDEAPDPELLADLATAGVTSRASARELLDHYVLVQLEGTAAVFSVLQDHYAKDTRTMSQCIGNALFAARHWVEAAQRGIDGWMVAHARKGIC